MPKDADEREYVGVFKNQGLWRARLFENDAEVYLGHYADKDEAAKAYDKAAIKLRGVEPQMKFGVEIGVSPLNFDVSRYNLQELNDMTFEELVQTMRLKSRNAIPADVRSTMKLR